MNNSKRLTLQKALTASVVYENAYPYICDIITDRNMMDVYDYPFREIWGAVEQLYPKEPIDLITLITKIPHFSMKHFDCCESPSTNGAFEHYAIKLLEIDIKEKITLELEHYYAQYLQENDLRACQDVQDCIKHIKTHEIDIFDIIPQLVKYGNVHKVERLQVLEETDFLIVQKARKIANRGELKTLLSLTNNVATYTAEQNQEVHLLIKLATQLIQGRKLNQDQWLKVSQIIDLLDE